MKNYQLVVRRNVSYVEYADVIIKADSLEEAKEIAKEAAEQGEYEFDYDEFPDGEYEVFSEDDE